MENDAVNELMMSLSDDDFPLVVYGPNIISPETNGDRDSRNNLDSRAIFLEALGTDKLINFKH